MAALALVGALATALYGLLVLAPLRLDRNPPSRSLNLARALGEDVSGLARFVLGVLALFALYLAALSLARRCGRWGPAVALGGAAAQALALLPAHPFYSFDAFHYLATARVQYFYGANPLTVAPAAFAADPLLRLSDWGELPSPYGPLWSLLLALPSYAVRGSADATVNLLALKGLVVALLLLTAWLVGATAERLRPGSRTAAIVLFGWNPLVLLHIAGDAHNDIAMACLLALALWLVTSGRPVGAAAALTLSFLVKFVTLLFLPLLLVWLLRSGRPARRREAARCLLVSGALVLLLYAPFWAGRATFAASLAEGRYVTTSLAAVLLPWLATVIGDDAARTAVVAGSRLLFAPLYLWVLSRVNGEPRRLAEAGAGAALLYMLVATPWLMPWYALTPLVCVAALPSDRRSAIQSLVVALTLGALLLPVATNYLTVISGEGDQWPPLHAVAVALLLTPPTLVLLWQRLGTGRLRLLRRPMIG